MLKLHINFKEFILIIIIIILLTSNILLLVNQSHSKKDNLTINEITFHKNENGKYDEEKQYYNKISYYKFKQKLKSDELSIIAITDTSSNTYNAFISMINKLSYTYEEEIYVLELNDLSPQNLAAFTEYDERFNSLESDYIITIRNNKILSLTEYDKENLNKIIEGIGE